MCICVCIHMYNSFSNILTFIKKKDKIHSPRVASADKRATVQVHL